MKTSEKIWWTKIVSALGVAALTFIVQIYFNITGTVAFMLGVIIYMGLSELLSSVNGVDKFRGLKIGVGAYFFTWILTWALMYTIIQTIA